jgi:hypothetical protein
LKKFNILKNIENQMEQNYGVSLSYKNQNWENQLKLAEIEKIKCCENSVFVKNKENGEEFITIPEKVSILDLQYLQALFDSGDFFRFLFGLKFS